MKFRIFSIAFVLLTALSCTQDPSVAVLERYDFSYNNFQGNRLQEGEQMDVMLWFNVFVNESAPVDSVMIVFEPVLGGGHVSGPAVYVSSGKSCSTVWTMGNESFTQLLRASAYDLSGTFITSVDLTAYAFRENQWDKVTDSPEKGIMGMAADTVNDVTFMVTVNKLYRQGSRYYIWEEVTDPLFQAPDYPREIGIDRSGVFYVSTWGGNIIRSTDHGQTWQACTKPWPDKSQYLHLYVANDDRLWISSGDETVRYSDDRGTTWHNAGSAMTQHGVGDIFRLRNGSLAMHGEDCCSLMMSDDDGQTWTNTTTPNYSQKLFVKDDDEIFICADVGLTETIYSSKNLGATFGYVHDVGPAFRTAMENVFNRWEDFYYVAIPGYGIMKSDDLHEYEPFWLNRDLVNMFIDHNGVLMVKGYDYQTVWYLKGSV